MLRAVPTHHIRRVQCVHYYYSLMKTSPRIRSIQSIRPFAVLNDISWLMGSHGPETSPWLHMATAPADSNQHGSPPAGALSSEKGQKEISLHQGSQWTPGLFQSIPHVPEGSAL